MELHRGVLGRRRHILAPHTFSLSRRKRFVSRRLGALLGIFGIGYFFSVGFLTASTSAAETFRVATYNVEGYLETPTRTRPGKSVESKAKVRESILAIQPDVLALQEIGSSNALLELRDSLKTVGLDLPYWEHVTGPDTNIHVSVL